MNVVVVVNADADALEPPTTLSWIGHVSVSIHVSDYDDDYAAPR